MTHVPLKAPAPPQGVIASLVTGFETVNARLELILLPLILDLFLWWGPHLSVRRLTPGLVGLLERMLPAAADSATRQNAQTLMQVVEAFGATFNVFSFLSTAPLGLPSLLAGRSPQLSPAGIPPVWDVGGAGQYALLVAALVLGGLFLGALYFGGIAQQVRDRKVDWGRLLRQVWGDWARLTALGALALVIMLGLGTPIVVLTGVATFINPVLGAVVWVGGLTLILWVLFYGGFALHAMLLQRRGLLGALWDSVRMVQFNLPHAAGLLVVIIVLNYGLSLVWNIPRDDSWLLALGVAGHALISTALITATFVFYQDRYRWWMEVRRGLAARAEGEKRGLNRRA
jgi:hypothetical protein